jgi:hypothetical protein
MQMDIMTALEQFDATEANVAKLLGLWEEIQRLIPAGIEFGSNPEYEDRSRSFQLLLNALPQIDGWKPKIDLPALDDVAQCRFDYMELDEPGASAEYERSLMEPGRLLREYRFRFDQKRRALVRDPLVQLIDAVDIQLNEIRGLIDPAEPPYKMPAETWEKLRSMVDKISVLMGSSVVRPPRWGDLQRHLGFGEYHDFQDITRLDWPTVREALRAGLYGKNDPLPVEATDLSDLVAAKPAGPVTVGLNWSNLSDEQFERLLFSIISTAAGYENPEWLMKTRAADTGRDLSVTRVATDALSGTRRYRVVIQCKHWLTKSVGVEHISPARDQMALWRDPPVDVLVFATSGRFTSAAVQWIEQHNASLGSQPKIEMWPESHLERLLAERPALVAEFHLR